MSVLGNRVQRIEDVRFLLGQGRYVANVAPPDAADSALFVLITRLDARRAALLVLITNLDWGLYLDPKCAMIVDCHSSRGSRTGR